MLVLSSVTPRVLEDVLVLGGTVWHIYGYRRYATCLQPVKHEYEGTPALPHLLAHVHNVFLMFILLAYHLFKKSI